MSAVNAQLTVISRAGDPAQHLLEKDYDQTFQLTTTDSAYTTDSPAFATTVYNYYNAQVGTANVSNVEVRWVVWVGGDSKGGGQTTNDGEIGTISSHTDLENELNSHIAHALTGDVVPPGV